MPRLVRQMWIDPQAVENVLLLFMDRKAHTREEVARIAHLNSLRAFTLVEAYVQGGLLCRGPATGRGSACFAYVLNPRFSADLLPRLLELAHERGARDARYRNRLLPLLERCQTALQAAHEGRDEDALAVLGERGAQIVRALEDRAAVPA